MGLFNKLLKDVTDKTKEMAGTVVQKAQSAAGMPGAGQGPREDLYYPQMQDMKGPFSVDSSLVQIEEEQQLWEPVKGDARTFGLSGKVLEVPQNLDVLNAYRLTFRALAMKCADKAEKEYKEKILDAKNFIEIFPHIYHANLQPLIKKAVDILIAENVWTVTFDSFIVQHKERYHNAIDVYEGAGEAITATAEAAQEAASGIMSFATDFIKSNVGAASGDIGGKIFDSVSENIGEKMQEQAKGLTPEELQELYGRIVPEEVFERMFIDYWNVFITLVLTLVQNGHDIWLPSGESTQQASSIFQNLSNPNFPQDKVVDVIISLLKTNPYKADYFKFMVTRFGETEEVTAIRNYFGYTDLVNPRII